MSTVVIVGTGLLGSSFGLAVKRAGLFHRVIGVSSTAVVEKAIAVGAVDESLPLDLALPLADLVLLAQPVRRILSLLETIDPHLRPGTLVTDVGSTKSAICAAGARCLTQGRFVGGHPMAGREVRGPDGASADLFQGRPWVLTEHVAPLISLVEAVGGRPVFLSAEEHDRMVSLSSHLPQLLSTGLASYLAGKDVKQVVGPGLLDMTRLAQSSYELWEDILVTNSENVDAALSGCIQQLTAMRQALADGSLANFFDKGADTARDLRKP